MKRRKSKGGKPTIEKKIKIVAFRKESDSSTAGILLLRIQRLPNIFMLLQKGKRDTDGVLMEAGFKVR